jgi:hypothetical protein
MKKLILGALASIALFGFSVAAYADSVSEVYNCKLEEGKTLEDAQAVNSKWLAFVRANVDEEIRSTAATPLVGDSDSFLYVDTYPDLETWAAAKAALDTDEGQAVEGEFEGVMECSGNRLWENHTTE